MDSITRDLSRHLSNIFNHLFSKSETLSVVYNGRDHMDYIFGPLGYMKKILTRNHIEMDPMSCYTLLLNNLNLPTYEIGINDNYLYFNSKYENTASYLQKAFQTDLIQITDQPKKILVDFSSPNIAKNMHVGHLRSTIIGDSFCRLFEISGHTVHRINHIGDFGLPFGMLIQLLLIEKVDMETITIDDLHRYYVASYARFNEDKDFAKGSHACMVSLQNGDPEIVAYWNRLKDVSLSSYHEIYEKLGITLNEVGESFYRSMIPDVIAELQSHHLLIQEQGRQIIRVPSYLNEPLTVVKNDGGYTYDTTDLAALRYRLVDLNMDKIIYVVDAGQASHFTKIFWVAKQCGWCGPNQDLIHTPFGVVLNKGGSKIKSREHTTTKLKDLLNQSLIEVSQIVSDRATDQEHTIADIAYGSIKYYDLSMKRTSDYEFSFEKILNLNGNSGPYLLYANARINAIIAKSNLTIDEILSHLPDFTISNSDEARLGQLLLQLTDVLTQVAETLMFHHLAKYMHSLASTFHTFIQNNQCLTFKEDQISNINYNRLLLCYMTKTVLEKCFYLMGMKPVYQM